MRMDRHRSWLWLGVASVIPFAIPPAAISLSARFAPASSWLPGAGIVVGLLIGAALVASFNYRSWITHCASVFGYLLLAGGVAAFVSIGTLCHMGTCS